MRDKSIKNLLCDALIAKEIRLRFLKLRFLKLQLSELTSPEHLTPRCRSKGIRSRVSHKESPLKKILSNIIIGIGMSFISNYGTKASRFP